MVGVATSRRRVGISREKESHLGFLSVARSLQIWKTVETLSCWFSAICQYVHPAEKHRVWTAHLFV